MYIHTRFIFGKQGPLHGIQAKAKQVLDSLFFGHILENSELSSQPCMLLTNYPRGNLHHDHRECPNNAHHAMDRNHTFCPGCPNPKHDNCNPCLSSCICLPYLAPGRMHTHGTRIDDCQGRGQDPRALVHASFGVRHALLPPFGMDS